MRTIPGVSWKRTFCPDIRSFDPTCEVTDGDTVFLEDLIPRIRKKELRDAVQNQYDDLFCCW